MTTATLRACPCCGLVQKLPELAGGQRALCSRCRTTLSSAADRRRGNGPARAAALAALILYLPAILLPVMRIERLGHTNEAGILSGSIELLRGGEAAIGVIVLACSVVLPLLKLVGLLALTSRKRLLSRRHRALTWHGIEWTGRWGMLDVLLIAVVVAWIKMGDLVEVTPGPAALVFAACVLMSLLAAALFDPHASWDAEGGALDGDRSAG